MIKIEKNIPIPKKNTHPSLSEFSKAAVSLGVGESFFCQKDSGKAHAFLSTAKKRGMKFTTRKDGEGTRIWRIA